MVCLQRPELTDCWDRGVFAEVEIVGAICGRAARDQRPAQATGAEEVLWPRRYLAGQAIHLRAVLPRGRAESLSMGAWTIREYLCNVPPTQRSGCAAPRTSAHIEMPLCLLLLQGEVKEGWYSF